MLSPLKNVFQKIYTTLTAPLAKLFAQPTIDAATLQELRTLLLQADTGPVTTATILTNLEQRLHTNSLKTGSELQEALKQELVSLLKPYNNSSPVDVYLLVGINGSGKTTCAGKLAYRFTKEGKKTLLVAADNFRAAAQEQLSQWATKSDVSIYKGMPGQDPGAVVFSGCQLFKDDGYDKLIIDTAGRLQTKVNLMHELAKLKRIIAKQLPHATVHTLLTIDSMLGQNSLNQATLFNECTPLDGLILTKLDGTGKGGIVFAINHQANIPVAFISHGETIDSFKDFDQENFVTSILSL
jgi:fused signal recognition particle receptor